MGLTTDKYLSETERHNVWAGPAGNRDPAEAMCFVENRLRERNQPGGLPSLVMVLGAEAMKIVGKADIKLRDMRFGERRDVSPRLAVFYLPHTSGRNRVWNDAVYKHTLEQKTRKVVAEYLSL